MSASKAYELLDERIRLHLWRQGWTVLRDVQEKAIEPILRSQRDIVIAAETAAGKTEAAFLPALTKLLQSDAAGLIVYISPLKALINDQLGRLEHLCETLEVPVWPWHGDISSSVKQRFRANPKGVLLITPEALEATLCNRGSDVHRLFQGTQFFVIDELHAFIGTERGKQLQSLMHRIEYAVGRQVIRVGLSATLGDMRLAAAFLRPNAQLEPLLIEAEGQGSELKMLVKGYIERLPVEPDEELGEDEGAGDELTALTAPRQIAEHLFRALRGSNNLVFPNQRAEVERYTALLNALCDAAGVPHEFWPHHGSLSKELRAETEAALKRRDRTANAVCTNTLELGIDIGSVKSVVQIGVPHSVASLRQRLGRSGRREGESKILRGYLIESELEGAERLDDLLRLDTVQMAATLELLLQGWFEPPRSAGLHLSTLVQQLLSLVAQEGGVTASQSYRILCGAGAPFEGLKPAEYAALLRHLGAKELLQQDSGGVLVHGRIGERLVNHYDFYAAFSAEEEYRLLAAGRPLGALPVSQQLRIGQRLVFAGKTWAVEAIDANSKTIHVTQTRGGVLPSFASSGGQVHGAIRGKMREVLRSQHRPVYFDDVAYQLLQEGRRTYAAYGLDRLFYLEQATSLMLFTWQGDDVNEVLAAWMNKRGFSAWASDLGVNIVKGSATLSEVLGELAKIGSIDETNLHCLFDEARDLQKEKWDWALPEDLLQRSYASLRLDIQGAQRWVNDALARTK